MSGLDRLRWRHLARLAGAVAVTLGVLVALAHPAEPQQVELVEVSP